MKTSVKKGTEIVESDTRKPWPKELKEKEKVKFVTTKQDVRKLLPRKSTRATTSNAILDSPPKPVGAEDELAQDEIAKKAVEIEAKEESTKKHKQKNKPQ